MLFLHNRLKVWQTKFYVKHWGMPYPTDWTCRWHTIVGQRSTTVPWKRWKGCEKYLPLFHVCSTMGRNCKRLIGKWRRMKFLSIVLFVGHCAPWTLGITCWKTVGLIPVYSNYLPSFAQRLTYNKTIRWMTMRTWSPSHMQNLGWWDLAKLSFSIANGFMCFFTSNVRSTFYNRLQPNDHYH